MDPIRFIIITVPPNPLKEKLSSLMQILSMKADTHTAISYPPHITLRTGALVPVDQVDSFMKGFESHLEGCSPFTIQLGDILSKTYFSDGMEKQIMFYDVLQTTELVDLNKRLLDYKPFIKSNKTSFSPHLSLAYNDLTAEGLSSLKEWTGKNPDQLPSEKHWTCDTVSFYYKPESKWQCYHDFKVSG